MSLNQVYLNLQKQHQPSVFIMTNIDKRIMTLWVGFLNSKVTRQHTAHLLNSCADPGHVGSNVHVDVKHIFLCNISLRRRCTMTWEMFTFPHWNAPAELTRPTKVPSSVVKAPPLSPWRVLMKLVLLEYLFLRLKAKIISNGRHLHQCLFIFSFCCWCNMKNPEAVIHSAL